MVLLLFVMSLIIFIVLKLYLLYFMFLFALCSYQEKLIPHQANTTHPLRTPDTPSGFLDRVSRKPDTLSRNPDAINRLKTPYVLRFWSRNADTLSRNPDALSRNPDALSRNPDVPAPSGFLDRASGFLDRVSGFLDTFYSYNYTIIYETFY